MKKQPNRLEAQKELQVVIDGLDRNNNLCLVSFCYGWLLAKGFSDEQACYIAEEFNA